MPAGVAPLSRIPLEPFHGFQNSLLAQQPLLASQWKAERNPESKYKLAVALFQIDQLAPIMYELNHVEIPKLNRLLNAFNQTVDQALLLPRLKAVYDQYKKIDLQYPAVLLTRCQEYHVIHHQLFQEIQHALQSMNGCTDIRTLDNLAVEPKHMIPGSAEIDQFAEIVANMDESIVSKMLDILSKGAGFDRESFLRLAEELNPPAAQESFKQFFETHSIEFLGGYNSRNFKISSATGSCYVLKVDNRMGAAPVGEIRGRERIRDSIFPPIFAQRNSFFLDQQGQRIPRNLVLTDFVPAGDLMQHARSLRDDETRLASALNLYSQMSHNLLKIMQNGVFFPDMKNTNWLVDEKNQLRIADMKSFLSLPPPIRDGEPKVYPASLNFFLNTPTVSPPEFEKQESSNVEASYSFMVGKNLYQYLTQCSDVYLYTPVANFDFNLPIFQTTEQGRALKGLIQSMIKMDPTARLTLQTAYNSIESMLIKKSSFDVIVNIKYHEMGGLLENLRQFKASPRDQLMEDFIQTKALDVLNASDSEARNKLKKELEATIAVLNKDPYLLKVKEIIQDFRRKAGPLTVGMKAKADRIERAFEKLPLEDRLNFMSKDTEPAHDLRKALASHRHFWKKGTPLTQENAAQSYKDVKAQLQAIKKDAPIEDKKVKAAEETDYHRRRPTGPSK